MKKINEIKVGDVLINKDGDKRKVLEVLTQSCLLSCMNNFGTTGHWSIFTELEEIGYTVEEKELDTNEIRVGNKYWFVSSDGYVYFDKWEDTHVDSFRLKNNNIYQTEAKAKETLDKIMNS
jgi:hypothetical protein